MKFKTLLFTSLLVFSTLTFAEDDDNTAGTDGGDDEELVVDEGNQAAPTSKNENCDEKLQAHLQELLEKDHNGILGLQYHYTMLKLAKKTVGSGKKSLEDYIQAQRQRLAQMNTQDPSTLQKLNALYNGQASEHVKSVYNNIATMRGTLPGLDFIAGKKIDNDDVASYILYESMQSPNSGFTKTDVAISWMMKNLRTRAGQTNNARALDFSNQVARYAGLVQDVSAASSGGIQTEMNQIKGKIDKFLADAKKDVMAANPQCALNGRWAGECTPEQVNTDMAELIVSMDNIASSVASKVAAAAARRTRGATKAALGKEKLNQCGGEYFEPKTLGLKRWEFGKPDTHHAIDAIASGHMHGEIAFGPLRCSKHTKKFFLQIDTAQKQICCSNKVTSFDEDKAAVAIETNFGCRAFIGVPYIAELGVKGGVALEGGLGGKLTMNPKTCKAMGCIYGKGVVRPYLAVYAEVLAGLAGVEGGINWEPQLNIGYCREAGKGKFKGELIPNKVNLYYTAKAGWGLVERTGAKTIYSAGQPIKLF